MSSSYAMDHGPETTTVRGVLRLESVDAYDAVFGQARAGLAIAQGRYTLDVSGVSLMNSSGIRALANLVLLAKEHAAKLVILGSEAVTWQRKTMASLAALYEQVEIRLA